MKFILIAYVTAAQPIECTHNVLLTLIKFILDEMATYFMSFDLKLD